MPWVLLLLQGFTCWWWGYSRGRHDGKAEVKRTVNRILDEYYVGQQRRRR